MTDAQEPNQPESACRERSTSHDEFRQAACSNRANTGDGIEMHAFGLADVKTVGDDGVIVQIYKPQEHFEEG